MGGELPMAPVPILALRSVGGQIALKGEFLEPCQFPLLALSRPTASGQQRTDMVVCAVMLALIEEPL